MQLNPSLNIRLVYLSISFAVVNSQTKSIPASLTVDAFEVAFFPCQLPGKAHPLWVINGTEYVSVDLIPDHAANLTGLQVYARPEYNNTNYQCRFVTVTINLQVFIEKDVETSPTAELTVRKGRHQN